MKIYHICPNHPYYVIGGVEMVVQKLAENLAIKEFDTTIITSHPKMRGKMEINKINIVCFKCYRLPCGISMPEIISFIRCTRKIKNSIIHIHAFHSPISLLTLLFTDKSNALIFNSYYHGRSSNRIRNILFKIYKVIFRFFLSKVDTFICISDQEKSLLIEQLKIPQNKINKVPVGYDISEILRYKWQGSDLVDNKKILYVGRLVKHKNIDKLVRAVFKDESLRLTIIGSGPLREDIKKMIDRKKLWDRIEIRNNLNRNQLLKEYSEADVFILPSLNESYGIVVGEAALVGCPVIVAKSQALIEFVDNKLAIGIELPVTPKKILEKIYDPNLKSAKGNAVNILKDWREVVEEIIKIYRSTFNYKGEN